MDFGREKCTWFEESQVDARVTENDVRAADETVEGFIGRHANPKARGESIYYEMADTTKTR